MNIRQYQVYQAYPLAAMHQEHQALLPETALQAVHIRLRPTHQMQKGIIRRHYAQAELKAHIRFRQIQQQQIWKRRRHLTTVKLILLIHWEWDIMQVNDYTKYYTWHCGDGKGKYGITNSNSVGIEICINSDGNYNIAFQNAAELTKYLMKELNIPLEKVVRHYDASRKNCPASMSKNGWALWNTFKKRLTENEEDLTMTQYDELKKEIGSIRSDVDKLKSKMVYAWVDDNMPDWAKPTVTKLMRKGYLKGDDEGKLNLDDNMLRILVINDRAGIYGE